MGLTVEVSNRPQPGVAQGTIPPELAELLEAKVPEAMKAPEDKEIILQADSEKEVKLYASYAKAWAGQQEPKLFIRRIANRRDMPDTMARLVVCLLADAPKLGRSGQVANADKSE